MFKFRDWTDVGQPGELQLTNDYKAVSFERLDVDIKEVYNLEVMINGIPDPMFFEDSFHF